MKIGKFEIYKILKKESYKTVYSALFDQNHFLIHKYFNPEIAHHEFKFSQYISSPFVDQFIHKFRIEEKTVLVQEAVKGVFPDQYFNGDRPLTEKMLFAKSVLLSLKKVHEKSVIYNNLSLKNITIAPNGNTILHNFASAVIVGKNTASPLRKLLNPHFAAPERSERVAGKASMNSDFYSFGVLLYWLLTGKLPFEADNISQLISLHVAKQPVAPSAVNPKIPEGLSKIIEKLLEKNPSSRYKSIEGILYDLEHYNDPAFQLASHDVDLKFKVSDKIYGREREIRRLKDTVNGLSDGKGQLVTISGYSGVGKSTIVSELQNSLVADECRWISGKFQQYKKDIPYFAIVEAFDKLFDMLLLSDQKRLDAFRKSFAEHIGDQGLILTSIFPKLELIVGQQGPIDKQVGEEAENRFNYVFLKLIHIVATQERPLVLFLDDLQWTDLVSLNVLRAIFRDNTSFLLVLLCYRSNEVDQHHPFQRFLDEVHGYGVLFQTIDIQELKLADVSQLIQDSLGYENLDLSRIVFEKTRGNAFFVHQLLKGLADQDYFQRDVSRNTWTIDLEKVSALQVSNNVVELMQTRLQRLPYEVTDMVRVIGAVGHNVNLNVLSVVTGKNKNAILQTLKVPFEDGLLYFKQNHVYFTHDKIQQACYQLNRISELPGLHFTIANTLIRHELFHSLDELFNLVGHLDKAFDLICNDYERYVDIYMMAALKSKEISAYKEFLVYVRQAMSLIHDSLSDAIRFSVYREYHIALYLNSLFEEADEFFYEKLVGYGNLLELRENYFSKVSQDSMRGNYKEATQFGMSILKKMGIDLIIDPEIGDLVHELKEIDAIFEQKGIKKISELQRIERKNIDEMEFISELILAMVPAAFFYNPTVACLLIFATLKLAANNGVFEAMGYPLSVASTPFILIRNDYKAGYEYAEYAMQIAAGNKRSLGNSKHLFILFCWHWSRPMKDNTAMEIARDAHHLLMQGGDIQMAGYTFYNTVTYLWERGETLELVLAEAKKGLDFNRKTQNLHGTALISPHHQVVLTLMSTDGDFINLGRNGFSEAAFENSNENNPMGLCFFYIYKTQLAYMCGGHEEAYAFGIKAKKRLHFITGFPSTQTGIFYAALSACSVLSPSDEAWSTVINDLEQLTQWNQGAPENFKHKVHLLEAEIARKKQENFLAIQSYTKALTSARQNRFMHETALICERFSSFWEENNNRELFEYYARQAFHYYELWGANRKCEQLKIRHPDIYLEDEVPDLDLLSVIHSQNVLAQETNTEILLKQMMQILLEISGAERTILILKDEDWSVEALKSIQGEEHILESIPLNKEMLPVDMVNYVIRTGQTADLEQFSGFLDDEYLNRVKPQSLIILPATVGSRIIAVIYLEHSRIKNIFAKKKQEMIKLLSTQIAISLNNAHVYNQLEQLVQERTKKLVAQNEELIIAGKKAEDANRAKSEFLANMSHELRTPLNAVTGFSELLTSMVSDPQQKSYLDAVKSAGRNLLTLINDILDLSKIEAGKMDITYAPVHLDSIFTEIEQIFNFKIEAKHLNFSMAHPADQPERLFLDEIRIRQVLLNLVGNAIKFTEKGFVTLTSDCVPCGENRVDLTICVEDSGIGIPEKEHSRIFQSFEQQSSQDTARYGGTGLGLAITKRLVELMNGTISIASTTGKGSRFCVKFFNVEIASSDDRILETGTISFENIKFAPARVMVVDDIESNRILLEQVLPKVGLDVITATNGQEAVLMAKKIKPELILMDIRMPVLSGFEAVELLKKDDDTSQIPIVALTASSTQQDRESALLRGFDGFVSKPFSLNSLIIELAGYLEYTTVDESVPLFSGSLDSLSFETIRHPEMFKQELEQEVLPVFQKLQKTFVAGEFKHLANRLDTMGREFHVEVLSELGSYMLDIFNVFDIKAMKGCLTTYSQVIEAFVVNPEGTVD